VGNGKQWVLYVIGKPVKHEDWNNIKMNLNGTVWVLWTEFN
jgi:hypothetical protein